MDAAREPAEGGVMRILVLAPQPFYANRGTPIAVKALVEGLSEMGHRIDLLTYFEGEAVSIPGATIHRIPRPPGVRRVPIGPSGPKLLCDLFLWRDALRLLRRCSFDLIHAVEESAFIAMHLSRRFGIPFVFDMDSIMSEQVREKGPLFAPAARVFARLERAAVRRAAGTLAVCPVMVDFARKCAPAAHVALLPDRPVPIPPGKGGAASDSAGLSGLAGVRFLYVGNLERYQGIDLMLSAFSRAASAAPDMTLTVVGGGTADVAACQARAAEMAGGERVRFVGPRPLAELPALLRAADALVSPRLKGVNTPMKIYNYMAAGRPVLATRILSHTQVLDDGTALLRDPEPAAFADGFRRLAEDAELRKRLGMAAKETVEREYGAERHQERLVAFYESLVGRPRGGGL
jgi:glycosyltransferase involved in cell wall biosynthesis